MNAKGYVYLLGDNINTDYIIAAKYRSLSLSEMSQHIFEDIDPAFLKKVKPGDFIVAGENFGCGSSREYAPKVILDVGIGGVIAKSFARIFYRNSINTGLPLLECDTAGFLQGDEIAVFLEEGRVDNLTRGLHVAFPKIPSFMMRILKEKGMAGYLKKYKTLSNDKLY